MIAFAVAISDRTTYSRAAVPGLRRVAEPDSPVAELTADAGSLHACYDEALDHFAAQDDLEALVLLHQDTELLDLGFCARVRAELADPDVAVCGAIGARDVSSLAWWEGQLVGHVEETRGAVSGLPAPADADAVDGLLLVLSPWAVRELRFGHPGAEGFDGYDVDLCFQARARGRRVRVMDTAVHHHCRAGRACDEAWHSAARRFERRWPTARRPVSTSGPASPSTSRPAAAGAHVASQAAPGYFDRAHGALLERVPDTAATVLDVGCGSGALGVELKARRRVHVVGLEVVPEVAARAAEHLDEVVVADLDGLEELPLEQGTLGAAVFGDVLEHLRDPARLLALIADYLSEDGLAVISVPNVGHWSVVGPLLGADRFHYEQHGLLDRTHVHLFTVRELVETLQAAELEAVEIGSHDIALPAALEPLVTSAVALGASAWDARRRLEAYQYLVTARPVRSSGARRSSATAQTSTSATAP